jgi:hypothetical protein
MGQISQNRICIHDGDQMQSHTDTFGNVMLFQGHHNLDKRHFVNVLLDTKPYMVIEGEC